MKNGIIDNEIREGLKQVDARILTYLFDKYFTSLCYFAVCIISNQEEAKDIVMRVFDDFWQRCENFSSEPDNCELAIKAYLYYLTRNRCLNYSRDNQRRKELEQKYINGVETVFDNQLENLNIDAELIRKLYSEIENLPKKCKAIFKLFYFEGLKTSEIASQLNISKSTVLSQKARALKMLKFVFTGKGLMLLCLKLIGEI